MMKCLHTNLKTFTFSPAAGGKTIEFCPDCTKFDAARLKILNPGKTQKSAAVILEESGYRYTLEAQPVERDPAPLDEVGPVAILMRTRDDELAVEQDEDELRGDLVMQENSMSGLSA